MIEPNTHLNNLRQAMLDLENALSDARSVTDGVEKVNREIAKRARRRAFEDAMNAIRAVAALDEDGRIIEAGKALAAIDSLAREADSQS